MGQPGGRYSSAGGEAPRARRPCQPLPALAVALALLPLPAPTLARPPNSAGVAITPDFARALYDRIAPLREPDGCVLQRFDTAHTRITISLQAPSGDQHALTLAVVRQNGFAGCASAKWSVASGPKLGGECGATLTAIKRTLAQMPLPQRRSALRFPPDNYTLLVLQFFLLVLGTLHILYREARTRRPVIYGPLALLLVWLGALLLRLTLSPQTFLHEYYHIAETITGYLSSEMAPTYGRAGPALYRFIGAVSEQPDDLRIIFVTNAVIASLAIPAVALLDLAVTLSWPRAICAAVLLCVLPQHLRFSAAEDFFILAVTFAIWTLALFALYLRTRRLEDALCAALALSLGMQTRPEMTLFPGVLIALVLLVEPRSWRVLFAPRTLAGLSVAAVLLIPRFLELREALPGGPTVQLPDVDRYLQALAYLQTPVTPRIYWLLAAVGLLWGLRYKPGFSVWVLLVFFGYTSMSLTLFDNPQYNLRSQLLPTSFVVLIAAGVAPLWIGLWGTARRTLATGIGAVALVMLAAGVVYVAKGFVTKLMDQQLEWAFLERTVPQLPERGTLLSAVEVGGFRLNAFPDFLLHRAGKTYEMIDVRSVAAGGAPWPRAGDDVLFYQGMFCHFALLPDEPRPDPLSAPCAAVHERYVLEPLFIEDLDTEGYSLMPYGPGPFRIGFYRLRASR